MDLLKQGTHTADEFITSFKELQGDTGFNDAALVEKFEKGLNSSLVDKIYGLSTMPTDLKGWMEWASKLDRQWRRREVKKKAFAIPTSAKQPTSFSKTYKPSPPSSSLPLTSQLLHQHHHRHTRHLMLFPWR